MSDKKIKKSDITKARIYEGAIKIFSERGYQNTTIRSLAKELNISLGNMYYHFKSKDDLLIHYFRTLHEETVSAVLPNLNSDKPLKVKVKTIIDENLKLLKKNEAITRDLINSTSNLSHPLSPFGIELKLCQLGAIDLFKKAIESHSKPGIYLDSVAFMYWFYYLGICLCWANDRSENSQKSERLFEVTFPLTLKLISITKLGVGKKLLVKVANLLKAILLKW